MQKEIVLAVVGAGKGADLEMSALKKVYGVPFRCKTLVAHREEQMKPFAELYGFTNYTTEFQSVLDDPEIDLICVCTPPYTHKDMIIRSLKAGKHVICEKPLLGYFGENGDPLPVGTSVSKKKMLERILSDIEELSAVVKETGKKFMYAENAIYAPAIQKAAEIIRAKKSKILYMKGEESLKGSTSPVANEWDKTGGGTFIRNGTHPLSAMLWLKQQEAKARGEVVTIDSIVADMGLASVNLNEYEHRHIDARPHDVEDSGTAVITFSDASKMLVIATNTFLGGLRDYVEVYCNDATINCKLTLSDAMSTYFLDDDGIKDMNLSYLCPSKTGWNNTFVSDEVLRGYMNEMQDFMESVYFDREPMSGLDIANLTMKVIYAAYLSAEQGKRVGIDA